MHPGLASHSDRPMEGEQIMAMVDNLKVGMPDVEPDAPAHTAGIREGNEPGSFDKDPGLYSADETGAGRPRGKGTARRSTGINPGARNPIDPNSPNLSPA
jgi:hypothetical protein